MPKLMPCPHCLSLSVALLSGADDTTHEIYNQAFCASCGVRGPKVFACELSTIAAWNSLPRRPNYNDTDCAGCPERRRSALTWTTEPSTVPGESL